ncbi:MAG: ATP-binding protein [Myxococcota bacterium]
MALAGHIRAVGFGLACTIQATFAVQAGLEGLALGHVIGLVLIGSITVTLVRSVPELLAATAWSLGTGAAAYALADAPQVASPLYFATILTLLPMLGVLTVPRVRLERALVGARQDLEVRVAQRTAELATAEREARRANIAKSRFLANMSHELRTPLNAILGYTELVQDELRDARADGAVADLDHVRTSAAHLLAMIDDVLDLTRVEAGELDLAVGAVAVAQLVAEVAQLVEPQRARRGLPLVVEVPDGLVASTDRLRLRQIVLNLLSNALKFTERGHVRIAARLRDGVVELAVADTGIGIAAEALPRLFQPFVQIDDAPTRRQGGTGLGLALSRDLARRLGGELTVTSTAGAGSTFTLTLPAGP